MSGEVDPAASEAIETMKNQLLIVLVGRLGGDVEVTVEEIDTLPQGKNLKMQIINDNTAFRFVVEDKT